MSYRIIVLDEAEDELIEAQQWYETQRSGLGREFRNAIDEGMEHLIKAPLAASPLSPFPPLLVPGEFWLNGSHILSSSSSTTRISGSWHLPITTDGQVIGDNDWNGKRFATSAGPGNEFTDNLLSGFRRSGPRSGQPPYAGCQPRSRD